MVGKGKELWAWGAEDGSCMEIFSAAVEEKRDELEDGPQKILCINQLERAESQMKSIKEVYKQRDKRAKMLMDAIPQMRWRP